MENKNIGKSFAAGALVLMLSNVIVKVIGALLKIPLTDLITLDGMAYYSAAYKIYSILFLISTTGLPIAVSRLVAKSNALGRRNEVNRIFKITITIFAVIGTICTLIMFLFANSFAASSGMPEASTAIRIIAPTILFVCIVSAIRGYFQGHQEMVSTGVSQLIEALMKLIFGYGAAYYAMQRGFPLYVVAAYAISGVTIGVVLSCIYLVITYARHRRTPIPCTDPKSMSNEKIAKRLIMIAIPVSLTSAALYLSGIIDLFTIVRILRGHIGETAAKLSYSAYTNITETLSNMPSSIIYGVAISALPAVVAALAKKNMKRAERYMRSAMHLTLVLALPCALGMSVLAKGIISFVYSSSTTSTIVNTLASGSVVTSLDVSSAALSILALGIVFITMYSTTNALMQSNGLEWYTIISVLTGVAVKFVMSLVLLNIPAIGIYGAPIGTVCCYAAAVYMNNRFLRQKAGVKLNIINLAVKPLLAAIGCGSGAYIAFNAVIHIIGSTGRLKNAVAVAIAMLFGAFIYAFVLLLIKGLPEHEIKLLPKGEKIFKILVKLGFMEERKNA